MAYSRKMIRLLDGSQEEKLILEELAIEDDYYYGYLGKAALSSSSLKQLLQSPKTYHYMQKYAQQDTKSLLIGKLFHWAILEPHKMDEVDGRRRTEQKRQSLQGGQGRRTPR